MKPKAMILCAGLGSRLRPLTEEIPKPLVPLGDRPLLQHIIEQLERAQISDIALNIHAMSGEFYSFIHGLGRNIQVFHEPTIRGTAGGVAQLLAAGVSGPVLIWNGDIWTEPPLEQLLDAASDRPLVLGVNLRGAGEGTVGLGPPGRRVVRLRGRSFGEETEGADYVGVAALGRQGLLALPEQGCLIADYALGALQKGETLGALESPSPFWDVGQIEGYLAANLAWLRQRAHPKEGSWVAEDAEIGERVELCRSVIGKGARVYGSGRVEECVIWPGAHAEAPLRRAVVTRWGRVVVAGDAPSPPHAPDRRSSGS